MTNRVTVSETEYTVLAVSAGSITVSEQATSSVVEVGAMGAQGPSGDYAPGGTDVAIADGGTGASTAAAARAALDVQRANAIDIRDYGAVGDGSTDNSAAIQAALNASAGGTMLIPEGIFNVGSTLEYDAYSKGTLRIVGVGAGSVLRAAGTCTRILRIYAPAGTARQFITLDSFAFSSSTATCTAGLYMYGIADFQIHDVIVRGATKMGTGFLLTGTQQGEISGCFLDGCTTGVKLDPSSDDGAGIVHSNGLDIHGNSFATITTGISVDAVDSMWFHGNHVTSSAVGVDILSSGFGQLVVEANVFELCGTAGVRVVAAATIIRNNGFACTVDIDMISGDGSVIDCNQFSGPVNLGAASEKLVFTNNWIGGAITDNSTTITKYGNRHYYGSGLINAALHDSLTLTSRKGTAGDILTLLPNSVVGGSWGMSITGAGSGDIYISLNDVAIAGDTGGSKLKILSGVGGTEWARFDWNGLALGAIGTLRSGRGASIYRPTAATVGSGAMWYDATLSKPIWSDGTNWRDAMGTIV